MTHRLTTNYAKNYCNRTPIVKVIVENVVTCLFFGHGVLYIMCYTTRYGIYRRRCKRKRIDLKKSTKATLSEIAACIYETNSTKLLFI